MRAFHVGIALLLLLTLLGGLVRILRGPSPEDRMLAAQLFGTTGVAVLLVLAEGLALGRLRDVAFVFSALAAVNAVVFARRRPDDDAPGPPVVEAGAQDAGREG